MKNPRRDYPKTLVITLPLITLCYLLPVVIGLAVVGLDKPDSPIWEAGAWTDIAQTIGGHWLGVLMAFGAIVSAAGLFSALLLSVTRIPFVMGEDGYLPKVLFKIHPRYGTPWVALVVSSLIYSVFILGPFQSLVVVDVTIYAAALLMEFVALVVLRIREPDMERPYRIPGGWFGIALVVIFPVGIIAFALLNQVIEEGWFHAVGLAALFIVSGPILYPIAKYFKKRRGETDELLPRWRRPRWRRAAMSDRSGEHWRPGEGGPPEEPLRIPELKASIRRATGSGSIRDSRRRSAMGCARSGDITCSC